MSARDPNRDLLERAAELLRPLLDDVVFVGGCATGLLISDPASGGVRQTTDVDAIVEVASYAKYDALSQRLRDLGFGEDTQDGVICRWRHPEVILDLMPTDERILGFSNRWFRPALATARAVDLRAGRIQAVAPVYFLATKIEAFHGRGEDDLVASHDLEDAIAVIDGREEILAEVMAGEAEVRSYLSVEFGRLLSQPMFLDALSGFLLPDVASQARRPLLLRRLRILAATSQMRLIHDDLKEALERKSREVTRRAAADGTLLTGGTVRALATILVEQLAAAGDRVIRALIGLGLDDRRILIEETTAALQASCDEFVVRHERMLRSLGKATKSIADEADRWFTALPDRVAVALRDSATLGRPIG